MARRRRPQGPADIQREANTQKQEARETERCVALGKRVSVDPATGRRKVVVRPTGV